MEERAKQIIDRLETAYPQAHCELNYMTPLQLVTAMQMSKPSPPYYRTRYTPSWRRRKPLRC